MPLAFAAEAVELLSGRLKICAESVCFDMTRAKDRQSSKRWRLPWTESLIPALEFIVDGAPLLMIGTGLDSGNKQQKF